MKAFIHFVQRLSDILNRIAEYLLIVLVGTISILIFVQVVFRYVFNHSIYWSEEVGRYLLIWITFVGASVGFKRKAHVGIDFLYERARGAIKDYLNIIIEIFILLLSAVMLIYGIKLSIFVRFQLSPALFLPMSLPYSSIAFGGFLILIHSTNFLINDIYKIRIMEK